MIKRQAFHIFLKSILKQPHSHLVLSVLDVKHPVSNPETGWENTSRDVFDEGR